MNFFDDESKIIEWLQSVKVNKVLLLNDSVAVREIFASIHDPEECKLCLNGMPVPLLRNCYSIFNGTKYR